MPFQTGDRVRIKNPHSEYTGCRGTIADRIADQPASDSVTQLGHLVAIDGENGVARPFLVGDLLPLRAASVRGLTATQFSATPLSAGQTGRDGRAK